MNVEKTCECGCGEIVKNRFVFNHHLYKRMLSEETQKKKSALLKGLVKSEETRKRISIANTGRVFSEETKQNMSKAQIGRKHSEETKRKIALHGGKSKGTTLSGETKKKMSEAKRGKVFTIRHREGLSKSLKGKNTWTKGTKLSEIVCKKISEGKKVQWKDPLFATKMGRAWRIRPNTPEKILQKLLDEILPGKWRYCGDFSFTINGVCPDFVMVGNQKKLIELFGDYWHQGENPQDRIDIFRPYGYDTLVIWEHELKNTEKLRLRIHEF